MDWAETRAREYNTRWWKNDWEKPNAALAALLREEKARVLAEMRRVVEDVQKSIWGEPTDEGSAVTLCCSEILSRLESL